MAEYTIAVLEGDGIGPEVVRQAVAVLDAVAERCGFFIKTASALIGGAAVDAGAGPLPEETIRACRSADAVLLGAVGGPKWDGLPAAHRPESGLLGIRAALGLYTNLRPAVLHKSLRGASPLKDELLAEGLDILIVRELTGGIYFGEKWRGRDESGHDAAYDMERCSKPEVQRIARAAFSFARNRKKRLCSVDKANVLESSRLWRETVVEVSAEFPDVALSHMYVDNAAMQLVRNPSQFDTIVTGNMFGDILSDEASQLTGSIGMLPSASLGGGSHGLYEPVHGSAPDIAGTDAANPLGAILSAAMLLRFSLGRLDAAVLVEEAVEKAIDSGLRTADIADGSTGAVSCSQMGAAVAGLISGSRSA